MIRAFQWLLQPPQSSSEALLKPPQTSSEMQGGFSEEANLDINGAEVTHPISGFLFTFGYWHFIVEAKHECDGLENEEGKINYPQPHEERLTIIIPMVLLKSE